MSYPTKQQLYGHRPHISKTIQIRQTRHAGNCWRSKRHSPKDLFTRACKCWMIN